MFGRHLVLPRSMIESATAVKEQLTNNNNVAAVRNAYAVAERKDLEGWINLFTQGGGSSTIRWV